MNYILHHKNSILEDFFFSNLQQHFPEVAVADYLCLDESEEPISKYGEDKRREERNR